VTKWITKIDFPFRRGSRSQLRPQASAGLVWMVRGSRRSMSGPRLLTVPFRRSASARGSGRGRLAAAWIERFACRGFSIDVWAGRYPEFLPSMLVIAPRRAGPACARGSRSHWTTTTPCRWSSRSYSPCGVDRNAEGYARDGVSGHLRGPCRVDRADRGGELVSKGLAVSTAIATPMPLGRHAPACLAATRGLIPMYFARRLISGPPS